MHVNFMIFILDYAVGFGGKFGVQADRQDKSAVGWDHHEGLHVHESQVDGKKVCVFYVLCYLIASFDPSNT